MQFRQYDRIEQQILHSGASGILYRWKWGRLVLSEPEFVKNGRLIKGKLDELINKARARGYKLSRAEAQYRLQVARTYPTEAQITQVIGQFEGWAALISARFPAVDLADDALDDALFDAPEGAPQDVPEAAPGDTEPYDPRAPWKKRDDAERQLNRILRSPEANGQEALPGLRIYLPGLTPDNGIDRDTVFREAFKIHRYICDEVTPQLRHAADQAERDDREREVKLNRMFNAVGRNLDASLGDAEDALGD